MARRSLFDQHPLLLSRPACSTWDLTWSGVVSPRWTRLKLGIRVSILLSGVSQRCEQKLGNQCRSVA